MGRELTPRELEELLGAYALDAVDGDERAQLEGWIARSPAARAELVELRETAALLAHTGRDAPPGVWDRIEGALAEDPPGLVLGGEGSVVHMRGRIARRGLAMRVAAGIAAASAAAAAITVVVVSQEMSDQDHRLTAVERGIERTRMRDAAAAAMADPRARTLQLESAAGATATLVTMPDGAGYLMVDGLPHLSRDRTYQLWAMIGDSATPKMLSSGVLGPAIDVIAFRAPRGALGFALTDERAPGAVRPWARHVLEGHFG
jgi:hypothetical protein